MHRMRLLNVLAIALILAACDDGNGDGDGGATGDGGTDRMDGSTLPDGAPRPVDGATDAGFDDLVATAQIGIHDGPKVALARNYWDELGRGSLAEVHTVLHDRLVESTNLPRIPRAEQPVSGLERTAIGGLLATNRRLQPEMLGALGLLELQAGPRCRAVVQALTRLDAPEGAFPFYREHATADPRHGKEWLDEVVAPLAEQHPDWAHRMVVGARWRDEVNTRFFAEARLFTGG